MKNKLKNVFFVFFIFPAMIWSDEISQRQYYICNRVSDKIIIDGKIDEPAWKIANEMEMITIISLDKPESGTKIYSLYDDKYLYFAFICYDKDIWATYTRRDSELWLEDTVEIFFKPNISKNSYYEIQISASNVKLDAFLANNNRPGNMFKRFTQWNCPGLKSAVKIKGTLNKWDDVDELWTCELAIPFKDLPSVEKFPKKGDVWLFNVTRYDYSVYLPKGVEVLSFSPIKKLEFHDFEQWALLKFN
ncbi:MAG: carbohydrate-binding family 9-like protein [Candidatus Omnitrophica bacterium]|nr:carbohydrate-binding family 9-like protein [Candidatus Omnitrophota bacterium]